MQPPCYALDFSLRKDKTKGRDKRGYTWAQRGGGGDKRGYTWAQKGRGAGGFNSRYLGGGMHEMHRLLELN